MKTDDGVPSDSGSVTDSILRTGAHYDSAPYPSFPYPRLQPTRLSAIAHLFSLSAPPVHTARVLEIGSAAGGHLIPLAAAYPQARFVGLDVSPVQIRQGQERIARLGLTNIELICLSITDMGSQQGPFDFIICHGVYSWVPDEVREAILRVCRERLAGNGIAVISYNVLPGWRMLQIVRDCALLHAGSEETQAGRAARVRQLLDLFKSATPEKTSYGQIWRHEAQRMRNLPDSYLVHELFEENNSPCTFVEFASAARRHGLAYLGETSVGTMIPEVQVPEAAEAVRALSGSELWAAEQYMDMISGRTFRQTLLVHEEAQSSIDRSFDPARLRDLHMTASSGFKPAASKAPGEHAFDDGTGTTLSTDDHLVAQAIERFMARLPSSSSLTDLIPLNYTDVERENIAKAFLKMLALGMVQISTEPIILPSEVAERPKAWAVARLDAASRAAVTATRRHELFELNPLATILLPLLDGTRTRDDLATHLTAFAREGQIVISGSGQRLLDDALRGAATRLVDQFLKTALRAGLLED